MRQIGGVYSNACSEKAGLWKIIFQCKTTEKAKCPPDTPERHFTDIIKNQMLLHAWYKGPANTFPARPGNSSQYYQQSN